jgi:hypothetical protein
VGTVSLEVQWPSWMGLVLTGAWGVSHRYHLEAEEGVVARLEAEEGVVA